MVEKIIVNPNEIRGYGNIMLTHSSTDYDLSECTIASGTDTVNGVTETVYTLTPSFTPPPTPTYLFYDACNSASGLTNYGNVVALETYTDATLTYDSTENAYALTSTGSGVKVFPIPALDGLDSFKLSMDIKLPSRTSMCGGFACINATEHTGVGGVLGKSTYSNKTQTNRHIFENNSFVSNDSTDASGFSSSDYYHMELTVDGYSANWKAYDPNEALIWDKTVSLDTISTDFTTLSERSYGLDIGYSSATSYPYYVKNIKAESLSPSPTPTPTGLSLSFNSSTYTIIDLLDGVTVSCTLTDDGTPLSGETVTFSWESLGLTQTVTATTNSSGVATHSFDYFDFESFPATVTATYSTASDTCTIQDGT